MEILSGYKDAIEKRLDVEEARTFLGALLRHYLSSGLVPKKEDVEGFQMLLCCVLVAELSPLGRDGNRNGVGSATTTEQPSSDSGGRNTRRGESRIRWHEANDCRQRIRITVPDTSAMDPALQVVCKQFVDRILQNGDLGNLSVSPKDVEVLSDRLEQLSGWAMTQHGELFKPDPHNKRWWEHPITLSLRRILKAFKVIGWMYSLLLVLVLIPGTALGIIVAIAMIGHEVNDILDPTTLKGSSNEVTSPVIQTAGLTVAVALTGGLMAVIGNAGRADVYGYQSYGHVVQRLTGFDFANAAVMSGSLGSFLSLMRIYVEEGGSDYRQILHHSLIDHWSAPFIYTASILAFVAVCVFWADNVEVWNFGRKEVDILNEAAESTYAKGLSSCAILASSGVLSPQARGDKAVSTVSLPLPQPPLLGENELRKAFYGCQVHSQYYADKEWNPWDTPWSIGLVHPGWKEGGCRIPSGELPTKISVSTRNRNVASVFRNKVVVFRKVNQGMTISRSVCPFLGTGEVRAFRPSADDPGDPPGTGVRWV